MRCPLFFGIINPETPTGRIGQGLHVGLQGVQYGVIGHGVSNQDNLRTRSQEPECQFEESRDVCRGVSLGIVPLENVPAFDERHFRVTGQKVSHLPSVQARETHDDGIPGLTGEPFNVVV